MLKTLIVLPSGAQLGSDVIQSLSIIQSANTGSDLTLGSVCATSVEITMFAAEGQFKLEAGTEFVLYQIDEQGNEHQVGIFVAEKPEQLKANTFRVTAYDRISKLDKDLSTWLATLDSWPYTLYDFAVKTCQACDLALFNSQLDNGSYLVQPFQAEGITGRQLMQWVGEATGNFVRATANGEIELAWYEIASAYSVGPSKLTSPKVVLPYYAGSLSYSDYFVQPIQKVQIRRTENDNGVVWPSDLREEVNTYIITGNYLLTAQKTADLSPVAKLLYTKIKDISYVPCRVTVPASTFVQAGQIIQIKTISGQTFQSYITTRSQSGQRDTIESVGSLNRESSYALNSTSFKALAGRVLSIRADLEGFRVEHADTGKKVSVLELTVDGIEGEVSNQKETVDGIQKDITTIKQDAGQVKIDIQSIYDNGVSKVKTGASYTFDDNGLQIEKFGDLMGNRLDNTGMYVTRAGQALLTASADGVEATDVKVNNYLIMGKNARFEDYQINRTACFYVGG